MQRNNLRGGQTRVPQVLQCGKYDKDNKKSGREISTSNPRPLGRVCFSTHAALVIYAVCAKAIAEGRLGTQFLILVNNAILPLGDTIRSPGESWVLAPFPARNMLPDCYRVYTRPKSQEPSLFGVGSRRSVTPIPTVRGGQGPRGLNDETICGDRR